MSRNYHEKLADLIVKEIIEVTSDRNYDKAIMEITAIGKAAKVAKGKSKLKSDLKKSCDMITLVLLKMQQRYYKGCQKELVNRWILVL